MIGKGRTECQPRISQATDRDNTNSGTVTPGKTDQNKKRKTSVKLPYDPSHIG